MYIAASTNIYHTSLNISSAARFSGKTSFDSRFSIYVLFDSIQNELCQVKFLFRRIMTRRL